MSILGAVVLAFGVLFGIRNSVNRRRAHARRPARAVPEVPIRRPRPTAPDNTAPCISCQDDIPRDTMLLLHDDLLNRPLNRAPTCNHMWCLDCLKGRFEAVLKDRSLWPPACCNKIPFAELEMLALNLLDNAQYATFTSKAEEYRATNPTYCPVKTCAAFIPQPDPRFESSGPSSATGNHKPKLAVCGKCSTAVCTECKEQWHPPQVPCKKDPDTQKFEELVEQEMWASCPECKATIELAHGCNHMVCICKKQFCYVCKNDWHGSCPCPPWSAVKQQRALNRPLPTKQAPVRILHTVNAMPAWDTAEDWTWPLIQPGHEGQQAQAHARFIQRQHAEELELEELEQREQIEQELREQEAQARERAARERSERLTRIMDLWEVQWEARQARQEAAERETEARVARDRARKLAREVVAQREAARAKRTGTGARERFKHCFGAGKEPPSVPVAVAAPARNDRHSAITASEAKRTPQIPNLYLNPPLLSLKNNEVGGAVPAARAPRPTSYTRHTSHTTPAAASASLNRPPRPPPPTAAERDEALRRELVQRVERERREREWRQREAVRREKEGREGREDAERHERISGSIRRVRALALFEEE